MEAENAYYSSFAILPGKSGEDAAAEYLFLPTHVRPFDA